MPVYVALLRGINVSGHRIVRMERLRSSFEALGCTRVRTYVQSGNVVFDAPDKREAALAGRIEARLGRDFGFPVPALVLGRRELEQIVRRNPFLADATVDQATVHATFLAARPSRSALARVRSLDAGADRLHACGRVVYLYCPRGYGQTKLSNAALERHLAVAATTRNWRTVTTLFWMASR